MTPSTTVDVTVSARPQTHDSSSAQLVVEYFRAWGILQPPA
jgi:hypothetical protein